MAKRKKRQPKPKQDPEQLCEAFLAEVSEDVYAELPSDIVGVMEDATEAVLLRFPKLANRERALQNIVGRRVRRHYRGTRFGWEFDPDRCEAFMELLIKYLPIFIDMLAKKHPAIAAALAA